MKIDVEAKAHAVVSVGVAASGTVIPPKVDSFGITSSEYQVLSFFRGGWVLNGS